MTEVIKAEIKIKETKIEELSEVIDSLELKINDQTTCLDALNSKTQKT